MKSLILFEHMLGRGTRKGEHFPDKSHFVVFDCFDGTLLEYFKNATAITAEPPEREPCTIVEIIVDIWSNRDRDYNIRRLVKRLQRIEKEMSGEARDRTNRSSSRVRFEARYRDGLQYPAARDDHRLRSAPKIPTRLARLYCPPASLIAGSP